MGLVSAMHGLAVDPVNSLPDELQIYYYEVADYE